MIQHEEGTLSSGGLELYYQRWRPDTPAKAAIALIHGLGEHSGRYRHVVNCLVPAGYAIHSFDHRGHGRSPGQRAHILSWDEYRGDVGALVERVTEQEKGLPLFLYGHSLGGLIVLDYALHSPQGLRGVISSSPVLTMANIPPALQAISKVLTRVWPSLSLKTGLDTTAISRDPEEVKLYTSDPLVHGVASVRWGTELIATIQWTNDHAGDWQKPSLLLFHGSGDRITSSQASKAFFDRVPITDKEHHEYEGGFHESHNDIDKDRVLNDVLSWLDRHV